MMIVRQRNVLHISSLLLFLAVDVASITLSQFQKIQGFSKSCEDAWKEDIPGCTKQDFASSDSCSRSCLAGVNIINAEVLVACSDAQVDSNTLLGEFLDGNGVSALCGGDTATTTSAAVTSSEGDSTTAVAATTTTGSVSSAKKTTTTAESSTLSTQSVQSTQPPSQSTTIASSTSSSSSSSTPSPTTDPNLTITFTGSTSTASQTSSSSSSASSTSTKKPDPEAKGFGGVGNAFDILGDESSAVRLESLSFFVMTITAATALSIAGGMW